MNNKYNFGKNKQNGKINTKSKPQDKNAGLKLPAGWFIMLRKETSAKEIANLLENYDVQVWNDFEVIEVEVDEKASIDIEVIDCSFPDEYSMDFVSKNGIVKIFYITFKPEIFDTAKNVMKTISAGVDGFVCADSDDFEPRF